MVMYLCSGGHVYISWVVLMLKIEEACPMRFDGCNGYQTPLVPLCPRTVVLAGIRAIPTNSCWVDRSDAESNGASQLPWCCNSSRSR